MRAGAGLVVLARRRLACRGGEHFAVPMCGYEPGGEIIGEVFIEFHTYSVRFMLTRNMRVQAMGRVRPWNVSQCSVRVLPGSLHNTCSIKQTAGDSFFRIRIRCILNISRELAILCPVTMQLLKHS